MFKDRLEHTIVWNSRPYSVHPTYEFALKEDWIHFQQFVRGKEFRGIFEVEKISAKDSGKPTKVLSHDQHLTIWRNFDRMLQPTFSFYANFGPYEEEPQHIECRIKSFKPEIYGESSSDILKLEVNKQEQTKAEDPDPPDQRSAEASGRRLNFSFPRFSFEKSRQSGVSPYATAKNGNGWLTCRRSKKSLFRKNIFYTRFPPPQLEGCSPPHSLFWGADSLE
jgi:hypothetical protein